MTYVVRNPSFVVEQGDSESANVALIRRGLLGCAPIDPSVAFSLDTLELYHRLRRRHPRLGIQPMMRTLCDIHDVSSCHTSLLIFTINSGLHPGELPRMLSRAALNSIRCLSRYLTAGAT